MRIVYFGTPAFAVPTLARLLASSHEVLAVVSQPDRPRGRGQRLSPTPTKLLAADHGVPVLQPERLRDESFLQVVSAYAPDLGVVAAYGRILPEALLRIPRFGMINVHASLLPRWRGAAPVHRAVIAGETITGVTIMRVVKELDAGPLFASVSRTIGADETSVEVERALAATGADLLLDVVERMAAGTAIETPQDPSLATYAPKIEKAEGAIDWNQPAGCIHNLVRGLQPWPIVSGRLRQARVLVHRTTLTPAVTELPPGTIVRAEGDDLELGCADSTVLRILLLQPEGRRVMTAREFLTGHPLDPGDRMERG